MILLFFSSDLFPFTLSVLIMFFIAAIEGVGLLLGAGFSHVLDSLFPGIDVDVDLPDDFNSPDFFTRILSWLRIGKVPVLVLILIFLTVFGLSGILIQIVSNQLWSHYVSSWIAAIPSLVLAVIVVRMSACLLEKIIPEDETEAVSSKTFIGKVATITLGTARKGKPAQAKLLDSFGKTHYIMVEPDNERDDFSQGVDVLIVEKNGSFFKAVPIENDVLNIP